MLSPIDLYRQHEPGFERYQALLLKWNEKINLTAITDPAEILDKHFLDSLAILPALSRWLPNVSRETFFPEALRIAVLDIGSGAGFPGLPLKIVAPHVELTLVDSVKKKCDFLKEVVRTLGLESVQVLHQTLKGQTIGPYDLILTRATFDLKSYLELAFPNLKPGGRIVAMKGAECAQELKDSEGVLEKLGLRPWESSPYEIPVSKAPRQLLMTRL
ncbi:MAG TPA: 16S rRNA (guanine(527)-N(7))-methyltransferase RsmG [bacterium]|nr:16S rRNA (guanine(527)-N(7))-methyltransferase RsmG [bacterium]